MSEARTTMNGKRVIEVEAKSVLNMDSGFKHKMLCDGPTFTAGTACAYSCSFCYVPSQMAKSPHLAGISERHADVVIRRKNPVDLMRAQLTDAKGNPKYLVPGDTRVIYGSPLVDVAANVSLAQETVEICRVILELTNWQIRLLSKSNLLPWIAEVLSVYKSRMIYGVSTGTLDDKLAKSFEEGTAKPSRRIASLRALQDAGYRTFGMICPSLPQRDYQGFAREAADAIRVDKCEHVWAEVLNARGDAMANTVNLLSSHGYKWEAKELARVSYNFGEWEDYSRATFLAHASIIPANKLLYLQYVKPQTAQWWQMQAGKGAVVL